MYILGILNLELSYFFVIHLYKGRGIRVVMGWDSTHHYLHKQCSANLRYVGSITHTSYVQAKNVIDQSQAFP
jgi:hypothetical protein